MGILTREIEDSSVYFDGEPQEGWELLTIKQNRKYNVSYYRDRQGGYHHTSARRKNTYNPFEVQIREKDGVLTARVVNKKTGKPIQR